MKRSILDRIIAARAAKQQAALVRDLTGGEQSFVVAGKVLEGPELGDDVHAAITDALRRDRSRTIQTDAGPRFVQVFNPPLRLIIVGAVHIAQFLAPIAALAGYDVTVVDPRSAFASEPRFPDVAISHEWPDDALDELGPDSRTAVVTLTHDPKLDDPALDRALRSNVFYIAALGSRRTHAMRIERLTSLGHGDDAISRIHGPAGLDLGAVSPAEIAVSVMAQMTAVLRKGTA